MPATSLTALISLPALGADSALLALVLVALLIVVIVARSLLAWQALAARAAGARRRTARLDEGEADLHGSFGRFRGQVQAFDGGVQQALWVLPRFDERIASAGATLADDRALLDELGRDGGRALRATFARIRGTLSLVRTARELRRTIWR